MHSGKDMRCGFQDKRDAGLWAVIQRAGWYSKFRIHLDWIILYPKGAMSPIERGMLSSIEFVA